MLSRPTFDVGCGPKRCSFATPCFYLAWIRGKPPSSLHESFSDRPVSIKTTTLGTQICVPKDGGVALMSGLWRSSDRRHSLGPICRLVGVLCGGVWLFAAAARAQDATWTLNPGSTDFNTASNWTPAT